MSDNEPERKLGDSEKVSAAFRAARMLLRAGANDGERMALNGLQGAMMMNAEWLLKLVRSGTSGGLEERLGVVRSFGEEVLGAGNIVWVDPENNDVGVDDTNRAATRKEEAGWRMYLSTDLKNQDPGELEGEIVHEWMAQYLIDRYKSREGIPFVINRGETTRSLGDRLPLTNFTDCVFEAMKQGVQKGLY